MTSIKLRYAALALTLWPVAAGAQSADRAASPTATRGAAAGVTLPAFVARYERRLMADDTDGDGKVSEAEYLAAAKGGVGDAAKRFGRIDRNGDGVLDTAEIDAMATRRFQRLDANGDGVAGADERMTTRGRKGAAPAEGARS